MQLFRTILPRRSGDMLALASDEGLCALEFTTVKGRARGEDGCRASTRGWGAGFRRTRSSTARRRSSRGRARWLDELLRGRGGRHRRHRRSTCAARRSSSASGPRSRRFRRARRRATARSRRRSASPGASRAVGAANGANPIAIIVPCHRVIGSSGSLTGYGGGLDRKTWLIDHERRWRTEPQARSSEQKPRSTRRTQRNVFSASFAISVVFSYSYRSARIGSTLVARRAGM